MPFCLCCMCRPWTLFHVYLPQPFLRIVGALSVFVSSPWLSKATRLALKVSTPPVATSCSALRRRPNRARSLFRRSFPATRTTTVPRTVATLPRPTLLLRQLALVLWRLLTLPLRCRIRVHARGGPPWVTQARGRKWLLNFLVSALIRVIALCSCAPAWLRLRCPKPPSPLSRPCTRPRRCPKRMAHAGLMTAWGILRQLFWIRRSPQPWLRLRRSVLPGLLWFTRRRALYSARRRVASTNAAVRCTGAGTAITFAESVIVFIADCHPLSVARVVKKECLCIVCSRLFAL